MWIGRLTKHVLALVLTVALGGFLGATLVRLAPGFGVDEQEMDPRLSENTLQSLRRSRAEEGDIVRFYAGYWSRLFQGDLGVSSLLQRPVAELLADRIPTTFRSVGLGLLAGWALGLTLAVPVVIRRAPAYDVFVTCLSGVFLCLPSAVVALLFLLAGGAVPLAIAVVVFPRVFRYARNLLLQAYALPHVLTAKAKGLSRARVLLWHVLPAAAPQILALAGVSVSMAFGAAIPIEVISDSPGIGQLAWQAALGRDLLLLINLTVLVTTVTLVANAASDLAITASNPQGS